MHRGSKAGNFSKENIPEIYYQKYWDAVMSDLKESPYKQHLMKLHLDTLLQIALANRWEHTSYFLEKASESLFVSYP